MSLGTNISYLRKQKKMTQEQLAERMNVTRQTVSRWEADEAVPELGKLVDMCSVFACKLDALVREELSAMGCEQRPENGLSGCETDRMGFPFRNPGTAKPVWNAWIRGSVCDSGSF